jgi:predicted PurR-regulated permease PerM
VRLLGTSEIGRSTQAFDEAGSDLAYYLFLQASVNVGFGVFVGLALWAIGILSPTLWGAMTAILRFQERNRASHNIAFHKIAIGRNK